MKKLSYDKAKDKAVMFFSCGSPKDADLIMKVGVNEILVSYFYIKKRQRVFEDEVFQKMKNRGGLLMVDSGGSTFIDRFLFHKDELTDDMFTEDYWIPYITEYTDWLFKMKDVIFVAANIDLEMYVGNEVVDSWNKRFFKPLEKHMDIVYVAHEDVTGNYADKTGIKRIKQYMKEHSYVGISGVRLMVNQASKIFALAKLHNVRIHGFGWTSVPLLKRFPFFSVDSTTWLGGSRYGTSYRYDGANFRVMDHKHKYLRKADKLWIEEKGIDYELVKQEKNDAINEYNLYGWLGGRELYLKAANTKLTNKPVGHYAQKS